MDEERTLNEIVAFISGREDVVHMYQTDPFIHSLLTKARLNKATVADVLEDVLVVYYTMCKNQSDEMLKTYLKRGSPIIKTDVQE